MDTTLTEFLQQKMISLEVASAKKISRLPDGRIAIPVWDMNATFMFNKYRRNPNATSDVSDPKYSYDKGANSMLYNAHMIRIAEPDVPIFICEGEFKALCLESIGLLAVSSTGGAGTFREEWVPLFDGRPVFIVLDNDFAGIKGAFSLQQKIPRARIIFLPLTAEGQAYGKDVTDFAARYGEFFPINFNEIVQNSENWYYDFGDEFDTKDSVNKKISEIGERVNEIMWKIEDAKSHSTTGENPYPWLEIYKSIVLVHMDRLQKIKKFFTRHKLEVKHGDTFKSAKNVPISNFIRFSPSGYARSVWNKNDKNPSMKFYAEDNRVYDYSTGQGGDAIDVYMAFKDIKFKEAIDLLASGKY